MKSVFAWCRITCCLLALPASSALADTMMLQGFDPAQSSPTSYSEARKDPAANQFSDALFHNAADPAIGDSHAKVVIVEFYDYRCPHCVSMSSVLSSLLNSHADVRIIYKEYPIRGKLSLYCAKAALAAKNQGKFSELHFAMMNADSLDENKILTMAKSLGLDMQKFQADITSNTIDDSIRANFQLGHNLRIEGTPTFYIVQANSQAVPYLITGEVEPMYLQTLVNRLDH